MTRWMWLALWGSIQLFFIAAMSLTTVRVQQIYRIVRRQEQSCRRSVSEVKEIAASITHEAKP
jgi:hypothetical protein